MEPYVEVIRAKWRLPMEQRAEIDGSGNIVVQIEGDRNTSTSKAWPTSP
jgi:hypothetical protein